ncbi:MAG: hypothetical protein UX09_C0037G0009 [Candidatus Uhrbacteria bacterium GW2011_GWE2_45_35]|uniref:Glycerophosphoryl diester phosphodiesterase membrane domain-containing protein n=1 Tax=Candidatus Uhrbacteria bacterium GW2011_GWE2_45_35 TaxID=1618993 RepID=A0A0G1PNH2_9BACT|nr:MAG: hypothetical protein UX09_C0037G0009 [Candidatus Uhrbacteria bacterium GW2011_GWE2_45_35]HBR80975.1 hypothetical protein [Candidatus Uhrbacteria bacterium]HCU31924.1 hypothetical protein [Candidatus Uhrbacteria bacterium]
MPQLITVGQIIDQSWEHYRNRFHEIIKVSAWLFLPGLISAFALAFYPSASAMLSNQTKSYSEIASLGLWSFNNTIIAPIIGLWVFIMLILFFSADWENKKITFKNLTKQAWKLFLPVVLVNFLVSLILVGTWLLLAPGLAINWLGSLVDSGLLAGAGAIILIVGLVISLILSIRWIIEFAFAPYLLIIKNFRGKKALIGGRELVKGRLFSVLVRLILPKLVFIIVIIAAQGVLSYILNYSIFTIAGLNTDLIAKLNTISSTLLVVLASVLGTPILVLADFIIFDNLEKTLKK